MTTFFAARDYTLDQKNNVVVKISVKCSKKSLKAVGRSVGRRKETFLFTAEGKFS